MRILIDILPLQLVGASGGAASFTKAVVDGLLHHKGSDVELFGAYDSRLSTNSRFDVGTLAESHAITLIDLSVRSLAQHITLHNIDVFFISIGQWYENYDLEGINCRVVMFIHDVFDCERNSNWVDLTLFDQCHDNWWRYLKRMVNLWGGRWKRQARHCYEKVIPLYNSSRTTPYTVSEYSRQALQYFFPQITREINVCWSPLLKVSMSEQITDPQLKALVASGKPYLMTIIGHRRYKNAASVVRVFERLQREYPDLHLLTLRYGTTVSEHHTDIHFLSDSDLQHAYSHAHCFVFPSFFEGFGYPPIEAMRYGTPVVASNTTSIPEIAGGGACLASPYHDADIYRAIKSVLNHHEHYAELALTRYNQVAKKQQADFERLISDILNIG